MKRELVTFFFFLFFFYFKWPHFSVVSTLSCVNWKWSHWRDSICRCTTPSHYIATVQCIAFLCFLCCNISERCKKAMLVHPTVTCRQITLMTMARTCQRGVLRECDLAFYRKLSRSCTTDRPSSHFIMHVSFFFLRFPWWSSITCFQTLENQQEWCNFCRIVYEKRGRREEPIRMINGDQDGYIDNNMNRLKLKLFALCWKLTKNFYTEWYSLEKFFLRF